LVVGVTVMEVPVTVPKPWLMLKEVALVTFQERVVLPPRVTATGSAVKALMAGGESAEDPSAVPVRMTVAVAMAPVWSL